MTRIAEAQRVKLADGRYAYERRPRGYVRQSDINRHGSYAKALEAINREAKR